MGLGSLTAALLMAPFLWMRRRSVRQWLTPTHGPETGLAIVIVLYLIDSLFNGMVNPVFMLAAGGLCSLGPRRGADAMTRTPAVRQ